jgi:HEAT repeat protein
MRATARTPAKGAGWGAVVALGALAVVLSGCAGGREARLQEVLRRSRAAPETISGLEKPFLEDSDPDVRALAVWAIGEARAPDALEVLSPLAKDPDAVVRLSVVRALCPVDARLAPEAVVALAQDPDSETRRAAVRCLAAKIEPPSGVFALALGDGDKDVRVAALEGLTRHPERDAMEPLLAAVTARGPDEQLAAVAALRALHDPDAVPALEKAAAERLTPTVRDAVEAAIIDLRQATAAPSGDPNAKDLQAPAAPRHPSAKAHQAPAPSGDASASEPQTPDAPSGDSTADDPPAPAPLPPSSRRRS